jgi:hypothetical protein
LVSERRRKAKTVSQLLCWFLVEREIGVVSDGSTLWFLLKGNTGKRCSWEPEEDAKLVEAMQKPGKTGSQLLR